MPEETIGQITRNGLVVPVMAEDGAILGGICVLKREDYGEVMDYLAAIQSLAAQIAAALRRIEVYKQTVESERMTRELEIAGQIQASFLPDQVPQVPGWEISAILEPARRVIPPLGGIDISPIVVLLLIDFLIRPLVLSLLARL